MNTNMQIKKQLDFNCVNTIEIDRVTKRFSSFCLDDISFSVPAGSIMGFIGENGAGKTTTIKLILNQLKKDSGSIRLFGQDSVVMGKEAKAEIGVVLDQGFFYEGMKPREISNVLSRVYARWDDKRFMNYLDQLQVPLKQSIKELSKGTRMKLCISCALAHDPKLLILDEATSGLDPIVRNDMLEIFQEFIQDEQHSILMSSHITEDLERVADYITFIHQGKIVLSDATDNILSKFGILKCGKEQFSSIPKELYIATHENSFGMSALLPDRNAAAKFCPDAVIEPASLENIMIFYHQRKE